MSTTPLFPLPDGLEITSVSHTTDALLVRVTSTRASSPCPLCATPSHSIHSSYRRPPADLPSSGQRMVLQAHGAQILLPGELLTERLPDLLEASSRLTTRLWREIEAQGYRSSATTVRDFVARLRKHSLPPAPARQHAMAASPRQLRWLLTRDQEDLRKEEREDLQRLLNTSAQIQQVHVLLQAFLQMVRQRQPDRLRPWMQEATRSGIPELKSFVAGLERDDDAVKEALRLTWSQGPTEGYINKLKTLKRMMYGRAGFELLRRRMLLAAS